jgi:hypothetical protein
MTLASSLHRVSLNRSFRAGLIAATLASSGFAAPQIWGEQVGSSAVDVLYGITADGAGGSYESGSFQGDLYGFDITPGEAFVTRRDALGNVLWTKLVATAGDDGGVSVAPDAAGGVFLAGVQDGQLDIHWSTNYDVFVARFDAAGNLLWQITPGVADYEEVSSCAPDGAGGVFVAGRTFRDKGAAAFQDGDVWLARIDASGNVLWLEQFGTTVSDHVARVESDGSGGALLCGWTSGALAAPPTGTFDAWFARYDAAGNQQSLQQFGMAGQFTGASGVAPDGVGGLFLGGQMANFAFVSRFDAQGTLLWQVPSGSDGSVRDLAPDGQGGVYSLGYSSAEFLLTNVGQFDAFIRHYDASGAVLQSVKFGSEGSDICTEIATVGSGVLAGGYSYGSVALFGSLSRKGWVGRFEDCDFDALANYCVSSPNSTGEPALIGRTGSARVSNNDFALFAKDCPTFETGVFLQADAQNSMPFGGGTLCVGGSVHRLGSVSTLAGVAKLALDMTDLGSPAAQITPGSTWNFQFWYRDTEAGPTAFNLSNGLSVTFCP